MFGALAGVAAAIHLFSNCGQASRDPSSKSKRKKGLDEKISSHLPLDFDSLPVTEKITKFAEARRTIHSKRLKDSNRIKEQQKEEILSVLGEEGIRREDVHTNGYWFQFTHGGIFVNLVNQTDRVVGYFHRVANNDEEKKAIETSREFIHCLDVLESGLDDDDCLKQELARDFAEEFLYKSFRINGNPSRSARQVVRLASAKAKILKAR